MDTATDDVFTVISRFDEAVEHSGFVNVLLGAVAGAAVVVVVVVVVMFLSGKSFVLCRGLIPQNDL